MIKRRKKKSFAIQTNLETKETQECPQVQKNYKKKKKKT